MSKPSTAIPHPDAIEATDNPVATFDIEAWRNGRKTPTRVVPVTNDPGAGLRLTELEEAGQEERARIHAAKTEGRRTAGARAGSTTTPALADLEAQIRDALAELDGTWLYIHVRAMTPHESNKVGDIDNRLDRLAAALAVTGTFSPSRDIVGQALTAKQWHDTFDVIGNTQTIKVEQVLNELSAAVVTPDFSRRVSSLLTGQTSSSS